MHPNLEIHNYENEDDVITCCVTRKGQLAVQHPSVGQQTVVHFGRYNYLPASQNVFHGFT
jgi:hypothetical protein